MQRKLSSFQINRFRGLRDLEFEDLGMFNILVGANNSGKTSVLEAIALTCRSAEPFQWFQIASSRDTGSGRRVNLEDLKWLFPQERKKDRARLNMPEPIRCECTGEFPVRSIECSYSAFKAFEEDRQLTLDDNVFEREPEYSVGSLQEGADIFIKTDYVTESGRTFRESQFRVWQNRPYIQPTGLVRPGSFKTPSLFVSMVTPEMHRSEHLQYVRLSQAALAQDSIEPMLSLIKLFDPNIRNISILAEQPGRPVIHIEHELLGVPPLKCFGDGLRRVITLANALTRCKGGILLIDELEVSVHAQLLPRVLKWLIAAAEETNVQIFATTHSLEAVDALLKVEPNDIATAYKLTPGDGVKRFSIDKLKILRYEMGLDVR